MTEDATYTRKIVTKLEMFRKDIVKGEEKDLS
jgi:hypothetical protein